MKKFEKRNVICKNKAQKVQTRGLVFTDDVGKCSRRVDGETYEKYVGLRIGERSETIVVLLTGCVPESEIDALVVDAHLKKKGSNEKKNRLEMPEIANRPKLLVVHANIFATFAQSLRSIILYKI